MSDRELRRLYGILTGVKRRVERDLRNGKEVDHVYHTTCGMIHLTEALIGSRTCSEVIGKLEDYVEGVET